MRWIGILFLPILFVVLGAPLYARMIPPNRFYGFRLNLAFKTEQVWYEINQLTGIALIAAGLVSLLLSIGFTLLTSDIRGEVQIAVTLLIQSLVVGIAMLAVFIKTFS